jgi:Rho-binding antiterminator
MSAPEYQPIACSFYDIIVEHASRKAYCRIRYYTELRELMTVNAVIRDVFTRHKEEFMTLASGETVRLDNIISIDNIFSPTYASYRDTSCDC